MIQVHQAKGALKRVKDYVVLDVEGLSTVALDIEGTFSATGVPEYTINGTDWHTLTVEDPFDSATTATSFTSTGQFRANVSGFQKVRVRCSAFTSGEIDVSMRAIQGGQL